MGSFVLVMLLLPSSALRTWADVAEGPTIADCLRTSWPVGNGLATPTSQLAMAIAATAATTGNRRECMMKTLFMVSGNVGTKENYQ